MKYEGSIILKIKEWLFEYAARFDMVKVLVEIAAKHSDLWDMEKCRINHVYPVLVVLKNIVYFQEVMEYPAALDLMDKLYEHRQHVMSFSKYFKLQLYLKMMVVLNMLKNDHEETVKTFRAYFPRSRFAIPGRISSRKAEKLKSSLKSFHQFFTNLVVRPCHRKIYMEEEYENDYGEEFQAKIRKYLDEFMSSVRKDMPSTVIEKILKNPSEIYQFSTRSNMIGIFLENLEDLEVLDESKVLQLLERFQLLLEDCETPSLSSVTSSCSTVDACSTSMLPEIRNSKSDVTDINGDRKAVDKNKNKDKKLKSNRAGVVKISSRTGTMKAILLTIDESSDSDRCAVEDSSVERSTVCDSMSKTPSTSIGRKQSNKRKRTSSDSPSNSSNLPRVKRLRVAPELSSSQSGSSTISCSSKETKSRAEFVSDVSKTFQRRKMKGNMKSRKKLNSEIGANLIAANFCRPSLKKAVVVLDRLCEADFKRYNAEIPESHRLYIEKCIPLKTGNSICDQIDQEIEIFIEDNKPEFDFESTEHDDNSAQNNSAKFLKCGEMNQKSKRVSSKKPRTINAKNLTKEQKPSNWFKKQLKKRPIEEVKVRDEEDKKRRFVTYKFKVVLPRKVKSENHLSSDNWSGHSSIASEPTFVRKEFGLVDDGDMFSYLEDIHRLNEELRSRGSRQSGDEQTILRKGSDGPCNMKVVGELLSSDRIFDTPTVTLINVKEEVNDEGVRNESPNVVTSNDAAPDNDEITTSNDACTSPRDVAIIDLLVPNISLRSQASESQREAAQDQQMNEVVDGDRPSQFFCFPSTTTQFFSPSSQVSDAIGRLDSQISSVSHQSSEGETEWVFDDENVVHPSGLLTDDENDDLRNISSGLQNVRVHSPDKDLSLKLARPPLRKFK